MELLEFINEYIVFVWIGIAIVLAIIEGATLGLTTIWFTVGAACSAIVALCDGALWLQICVFIAVSVILLIFTRPILLKKLNIGHEKNNVDQYIGKKGIVIEEVLPFKGGRIKMQSLEWAAVGQDPEYSFPVGEEVKVVKIEGVKAIIERIS